MAKITHPKDPNQNTRRRTTKGRGKWNTMVDRNVDSKRNSTTSWNRSINPITVKKPSTKNISRKK